MVPPPLAFKVLDAVMEKLPGFPIVLHGSSSVPQEEVETINKYGGKLKAAIGIPEEELRKQLSRLFANIFWVRLVTIWKNCTFNAPSLAAAR